MKFALSGRLMLKCGHENRSRFESLHGPATRSTGSRRILAEVAEIHLPLVVLGELRAGFANGAHREKNESLLVKFRNQEAVFLLCPDEQTTYVYAELFAFLRRKGTPIPTNDLWIASLGVQHNLTLFDRDSAFDRIPQLTRVGPLR